MSVLSRSAVRNSTVVRIASRVRTRVRTAASNARVTTVLGRGRASTDASGLPGDPPQTQNTSEIASTETRDEMGADATDTVSGSSRSLESSAVYRLLGRGRGLLTESRIFEWLTAEPEPEVIVIDLRETRTVGRVVSTLDRVLTRAEQDLLPALPAATVTRGTYWVRNRLVTRPLRGASVGLAVVANLGLLAVLLGSEDPITPTTLVLFAALLLAVRGFRSTMSLDELRETVWYRRGTAALIAVFEPPDPPESAPSKRGGEPSPYPDSDPDTPEEDSPRD